MALELLDFADQCRADLKYAVQLAHEFHTTKTEPEKVITAWAIALGTLTYDISGATMNLVRSRYFRAVEIMFRCLFEYGIRLSCYLKDGSRAAEDLEAIQPRFRRMFKHGDSIRSFAHPEDWTDEQRQELREWMERQEELPRSRVKEYFTTAEPEHGEALYYTDYALGSSYVHGDGVIFMDVIRRHPTEEDQTAVHWQSARFNALTQAHALVIYIHDMIGYVEKAIDRGRSYERLERDFRVLINRLGLSAKWNLES